MTTLDDSPNVVFLYYNEGHYDKYIFDKEELIRLHDHLVKKALTIDSMILMTETH